MTAVHPVLGRLTMKKWELEMWELYPIHVVTGYGRALAVCWSKENAEEILENLKESSVVLLDKYPDLFPQDEIDDVIAEMRIITMQGPSLAELFGEHGKQVLP